MTKITAWLAGLIHVVIVGREWCADKALYWEGEAKRAERNLSKERAHVANGLGPDTYLRFYEESLAECLSQAYQYRSYAEWRPW